MFKKPVPFYYCIKTTSINYKCPFEEIGDCSIDCEGDIVWVCPYFILEAKRKQQSYNLKIHIYNWLYDRQTKKLLKRLYKRGLS